MVITVGDGGSKHGDGMILAIISKDILVVCEILKPMISCSWF